METDKKRTDLTVALTKGIIGGCPFVGPLVAEVIGAIIPNQRIDRITRLVKTLDAKIAKLDQERAKAAFAIPGFVDLLEDGFHQAARALTDERIEYIAALVKNGLTEEQLEHVGAKKLLQLLSELNDIEVIILRWHAFAPQQDLEFRRKHEAVLFGPRPTRGKASRSEIDAETLHASYREHLVRLGLMCRRYRARTQRDGTLEFDDKTGTLKAIGHDITALGRLLLQHVDLIEWKPSGGWAPKQQPEPREEKSPK